MSNTNSGNDGRNVLCNIRNVSVEYERWGQSVSALEHLSLEVMLGEWLMIVGPNGSGKSTLLNTISGRRDPDKGEIFLSGHKVSDLSDGERAKQVFMVHQDPLLGTAASLTVFENLKVADQESGELRARELEEKYRSLLSPIDLEDRLHQRAKSLSGGERQLLALLIARLRHAPLILLDEPLASLDPVRSETCLRQIAALQENGKTLVHVTHNLEHAVARGDRTVVMGEGAVREELGKGTRSFDSIRTAWQPKLTKDTSDGAPEEKAPDQSGP